MKIDTKQYKNIVILTGAGVSAGSGIRTYRGKDGIWSEFDVQEYGHVDRLRDKPERIWQLFGPLRTQLATAKPNIAHHTLAKVEKSLETHQEFILITQNVDGLHQCAGSENVIELHGSILKTRCSNPDCTLPPFVDTNPHVDDIPTCPVCSEVLRPDIVLFGEMIPTYQSWQSKRALRDCDLFISVGTSGTVSPASNFVRSAEYAGARTIYINLESMLPLNSAYQEECLGKAEIVLPQLFDVPM
jgi:NAD-dependent deacetylase